MIQTHEPNTLGYIFWVRADIHHYLTLTITHCSKLQNWIDSEHMMFFPLSEPSQSELGTETDLDSMDVCFYNKMWNFKYHKSVQENRCNFCCTTETNFMFNEPAPEEFKTLGHSIILGSLLCCPSQENLSSTFLLVHLTFLAPLSTVSPSSHGGVPRAHVIQNVVRDQQHQHHLRAYSTGVMSSPIPNHQSQSGSVG